jgi:CRP-like cAMP-binding protein
VSEVAGADPSELASLSLFGTLSPPELDEVARWFEVRDIPAGVRLVGEGATGRSFFVVAEGDLAVVADGEQIIVLGRGDFFGELALLGAGRRTATVTAIAPSRVLVMFGGDFARMRARYPALAVQIDAEAEHRLA